MGWWFAAIALLLLGTLLGGYLRFRPIWPRFWTALQSYRPVGDIRAHQDLRWLRVEDRDLRDLAEVVTTLGFNSSTRWPSKDRLPLGFDPRRALSNAMNPGLGIRSLHLRGITGRGITVAVVDFNLFGRHPEYAVQLARIHRLPEIDANLPSMHGPAVLSLLAGKHCGTAPEARVLYVATPDPGGDGRHQAEAIDWILDHNRRCPAADRVRVISISAAPSGPALYPFRNGNLYDEACTRAEAADVLVIDGTVHRGFVGPCRLDPSDPENPAACSPVLARGRPGYFEGRLLCPTSPRTSAEEYYPGAADYQYSALQTETREGAGSSWAMPYAAGVAALALQCNPRLTAAELKSFLLETAHVLPSGERIVDPAALIERVQQPPSTLMVTP